MSLRALPVVLAALFACMCVCAAGRPHAVVVVAVAVIVVAAVVEGVAVIVVVWSSCSVCRHGGARPSEVTPLLRHSCTS